MSERKLSLTEAIGELGWRALDKILLSPSIRRIWANPFYVPGWRPFWERILQEGLP